MEGPNFEDLGPERFQRFCQAILVRAYPNLQCLPVAQPDGGRDAFTGSLVFQVKYARDPSHLDDTLAWIVDAIDGELPKVTHLASRGAQRYILLTNVPGTAHLDTGRVDRVQTYLDEHSPIPAMCLWRQDIASRLENAPDLYWAYPDLLDAGHLLQWFIERADPEDERRSGTLKTYLEETYRDDQMVRFRQVELENHVLDLYVDVPIRPKPSPSSKGPSLSPLQLRLVSTPGNLHVAATVPEGGTPAADIFWDEDLRDFVFETLSAASLLLQEPFADDTPDIVVEGAPGQGKSTVAQYICQVHRIRLLNKTAEISRIRADHTSAPVRVPFKVELRDFATWLRGQDPFRPGSKALPLNHALSLEALIAWHIEFKTGGRTFSVDDVHAFAASTPVLLVLDGLDEVADIALRRRVIDEASNAINRLRSSAASLQVIATSRPAAFSNSPGFPERRFAYLELGSLNPELVHEYAEKWCTVSHASDLDRQLIFGVLATKLAQPHIRNLSRNAMQMAILLNLISTLGESLPDARTALYDEYMKLFLRREAEKNPIIAKHRTLIIDIHRYLAWVLQTGAELDNPQGTISEEALKALLREYLEREGRDPSLADDLFHGILERVVALVKRIEGLFEFDVQPLREYFCARYLYDTAPSSSVGKATPGARPDRFEGIIRNPFWLNVTRFFAGCHTKGELAGLKESLHELGVDPTFRLTNYPRQLAFLLLADWVFEQSPKATAEMVSSLAADLGSRHCLTDENIVGGSQRLATDCGRRVLFDRCFELLGEGLPPDREYALSALAVANSDPGELAASWVRTAIATPNVTQWFRTGARCNRTCFDDFSSVDNLLCDGVERQQRLEYVAQSGAVHFFMRSESLVRVFTDLVMRGSVRWPIGRPLIVESALEGFAIAASLCMQMPVRNGSRFYLQRILDELVDWARGSEDIDEELPASSRDIRATVVVVAAELKESSLMSRSLDPWIAVEGAFARHATSESWFLCEIALRACSIRSKERLPRGEDFLDSAVPLVVRARYARLRSGSPSWWRTTLAMPLSALERRFALALVLGWATQRTIALIASELEGSLLELSDGEFRALLGAVSYMSAVDDTPRYEAGALSEGAIRLTLALSCRLSGYSRVRDILPLLRKYRGDDSSVEEVRRTLEVQAASRLRAPEAIAIVRREYARGAGANWPNPRQLVAFDAEVAKIILGEPRAYPLSYVLASEEVMRSALSKEFVPVSTVADREHWFPVVP